MEHNKHMKRAMLASILSVVVCVAMLIGTTFAWFTDSVTSSGNKIQAGNLNIDLLVKDANGTYQSVKDSQAAIFDYDRWEPGYTVVKNVQVKSSGNLVLKYTMNIVAEGEISKLAEVIDVYYAAKEVNVEKREDLAGLKKLGTLKDVLNGNENTVIKDTLIPGENTEDFATIALKMREEAGNEYQGLSLGAFDLRINAAQYTKESDSFDNQYDKDASYSIPVASAEDFKSALDHAAEGSQILLQDNIVTNDKLYIRDVQNVLLNFNQKTAEVDNNNIALIVKGSAEQHAGAVFSNGMIKAGEGTYCTVGAQDATLTLNDMKLENITPFGCSVKAFPGAVINLNNINSTSTYGGSMEACGGVININGGTYTQTGKYDHNSCFGAVSNRTGTLNVHNMTANSENYGFYIYSSGGTINIYDGQFKADTVLKADLDLNSYPTAEGNINIYGGSFDGKIVISDKAAMNIIAGTFMNTGLTLEQFEAYVDAGSTVTEADGIFTVTTGA